MGRWVFKINEPTPSLNTTGGFCHWSARAALKNKWFMLLRAALPKCIPKAGGKRRIIIHRQGIKLLDYDNLVGGAKNTLIDLLRPAKVRSGIYKSGPKKGSAWVRSSMGLGMILDDSPEWVEVVYTQERVEKKYVATVVTIEDM